MNTLGVDFSQWGGELAPSTVECWKSEGVRFAVVQYSSFMRQHLGALKDGGIPAEVYVYLYWGQDTAKRVKDAITMVGDFDVPRLWLDAEDATTGFTPETILERLKAAEEACDRPCGIYTGAWWWKPYTRNSTAFKHLPLWHAGYTSSGSVADLRPPSFEAFDPYGGWSRPLMWQYQGTTMLCGHSVDMNVKEEVPVDKPSEAELRLGVIETIISGKYRPEYVGPNALGERVVELRNADGTQAQPPILMAVLGPEQKR